MEFSGIWMRTPLRLGVNEKSTSELKPKQEWHKLDNEESEANAWALRHHL